MVVMVVSVVLSLVTLVVVVLKGKRPKTNMKTYIHKKQSGFFLFLLQAVVLYLGSPVEVLVVVELNGIHARDNYSNNSPD